MTVFHCAACRRPLTNEVRAAEPLQGPERSAAHAIAAPLMAAGTYTVGFDAALLILHPDDLPGSVRHPDARRRAGCCGPSGQDGPNLVCGGCGAEVATRESDCWTGNFVTLIAAAVTDRPSPP
jgi:hypothetical protein